MKEIVILIPVQQKIIVLNNKFEIYLISNLLIIILFYLMFILFLLNIINYNTVKYFFLK